MILAVMKDGSIRLYKVNEVSQFDVSNAPGVLTQPEGAENLHIGHTGLDPPCALRAAVVLCLEMR